MPGSMTSMPYLAVPLIFGGISSCGTETPTIVYWSGVFSLIALSSSGVKVLVILPLLTISAKLIDFFDFGCEMAELRTTSSPAGTPIAAAAGDLRAEHGVVELRIVGGELDPHVLPGRAELLGHDLRHGRGDVLAHVGLAAGHRDETIGRDREPVAGFESGRRGQGLIDAGNTGIAEHEAGGGGADQERAAAELGGRDFHVRIHVALRSVPELDAVRISDAARMIAF